MVKDITKQFQNPADPNDGRVIFEEGYDKKSHTEEIATARWLNDEFGGNIILLSESTNQGVKTPDYLWNGREWECKSILSSKFATIDKQIQKAYSQIRENRGGIVLDFTRSRLTLDEAEKMIIKSASRRMKQNAKIIVKKRDAYKVFQTTKK